jgi:hypothetical protein
MMNIYKKSNIINQWDDIISEEEWEELYNEVRFEVLNDIIKEKYLKRIIGGDENNSKLKNVIIDDLS